MQAHQSDWCAPHHVIHTNGMENFLSLFKRSLKGTYVSVEPYHLSPCIPIPRDHILIVLKSYFDGGNEADSTQYDFLTLGAIAGRNQHWRDFNKAWKKVLRKHGAAWLHTTDAMSLQGIYETGWTKTTIDAFIDDCVTVIENHAAQTNEKAMLRPGLRPITVTVDLKDFMRALELTPGLGTPEENCALTCFNAALVFGQRIGCKKFECYFDQGEKFSGFIADRISNKKSLRNDPILKNVVHVGQSDMREVPALQAADLFAWAVNDSRRIHELVRSWQRRLLVDIQRQREHIDFSILTEDVLLTKEIEKVRSWNLPKRRRPR